MQDKYYILNNKDLVQFEKNNKLKNRDWYNNQFHLSSFSGLINDPNGLVFYKGKYYIFMQNCPFSYLHYNKSWILYSTRDFINYIYEGITITPSIKEDRNGVFSGTAFVENNELFFYYTGNVKINDNKRTSYTIKAKIDFKNKVVYKKVLFEMPEFFSGHFRDPFLFFKNSELYMINGAQTKEQIGVVAIHKRIQNDKWILINNQDLNLGSKISNYMIECPNVLKLNNNDILLFSLEQNEKIENSDHRVWYITGNFDNNLFYKNKEKIKLLDRGFDFYAPQIFNNTKRQIIMGWNGNPQSLPSITFNHMWSFNLTIPREIKIFNNSLVQTPITELKKLRIKKINSSNNIYKYENGTVEFLSKNILSDFYIKISNDKNEFINLFYKNKRFGFDRSEMSFTSEELPSLHEFTINKIKNIQILIDRSILEIFINNGTEVITIRIFIHKHNIIETNLVNNSVYQLKSIKIINQNIIYKNKLMEK